MLQNGCHTAFCTSDTFMQEVKATLSQNRKLVGTVEQLESEVQALENVHESSNNNYGSKYKAGKQCNVTTMGAALSEKTMVNSKLKSLIANALSSDKPSKANLLTNHIQQSSSKIRFEKTHLKQILAEDMQCNHSEQLYRNSVFDFARKRASSKSHLVDVGKNDEISPGYNISTNPERSPVMCESSTESARSSPEPESHHVVEIKAVLNDLSRNDKNIKGEQLTSMENKVALPVSLFNSTSVCTMITMGSQPPGLLTVSTGPTSVLSCGANSTTMLSVVNTATHPYCHPSNMQQNSVRCKGQQYSQSNSRSSEKQRATEKKAVKRKAVDKPVPGERVQYVVTPVVAVSNPTEEGGSEASGKRGH